MLIKIISKQLQIAADKVKNTIALLDEGATVPFIARYRKEATGSLDEVAIGAIKDLYEKLTQLVQRKETILATIEEQGKLTPEITFALNNAKTLVELEDIYLPYRPKRKTRASVARDKGLEPLANYIMEQRDSYETPIDVYAAEFISEEEGKEVRDAGGYNIDAKMGA